MDENRLRVQTFPLKRPTGVSILSALLFIGGIILTVYGALILALGDLIGAAFGDLVATSLYVIGVVIVVLGIVNLFVAHGLWEGKGWAWILALAFAIIGLASSIIQSITILASGGSASYFLAALPDAIILPYLGRAHVRAFFGRGLSYNPQVIRYYTEEVVTHLTAFPAESAKVFNAFDRSGQDGVANYLKEKDPDLTNEEAGAVANAIISNAVRLGLQPRGEATEGWMSNRPPVRAETDTGGSEGTNLDQERKKEKSWIEKWLQR